MATSMKALPLSSIESVRKLLLDQVTGLRKRGKIEGQLDCEFRHFVLNRLEQAALSPATAVGEQLYEIRAILWDKLHSVYWKDTEEIDRVLFALATMAMVYVECVAHPSTVDRAATLQALDIALIMGASTDVVDLSRVLIDHIQEDLAPPSLTAAMGSRCRERKRQAQSRLQTLRYQSIDATLNPAGIVNVRTQLTIRQFYSDFFAPQRPVVLLGCMTDWPAMQPTAADGRSTANLTPHLPRWQNIKYILSILGHRAVPVETGSSYLSRDSGSCIMTGEEFIKRYIYGVDGTSEACARGAQMQTAESHLPVGYLAQHQLLDQIPRLREDICVPDYCALLAEIDEAGDANNIHNGSVSKSNGDDASEVKVQAWLGPVGTVSPLHHDPYYNLLAQTAGYKYIRLYSPEQSAHLHPLPGRMHNNSGIDLLEEPAVLHSKYPTLPDLPYQEYVLGPGEMLFIPRWWWHFVVAIDRESAIAWRNEHLQGKHPDHVSIACRGGTEMPLAKRQRVPLVLPPPSGENTVDGSDFQFNPDNTEAGTNKRKREDIDMISDTAGVNEIDFSFSVSFWWGARLLKSDAGQT